MSWTNEQIEEAVTKVMEKANEDAKFRESVLSDVYAAVKEVTGNDVPKEFKINVVDNTGYHATIVLPEVRGAADELTETELEAVAGGSKAGAEKFFYGVGDVLKDVGHATADRIRNS